jgi:metal-dependent amidase/aminoacylase/carboxypeptidase family protein
MTADNAVPVLPGPSTALLDELEGIYRDVHANPELSMQEQRTAGLAAAWLRKYGYDVTERIGGTGVVGLLRNGDGPTILLRADMDALPIKESTGLAYASDRTGTDRFGQATSIAHACGHDMHIVWLMGAARILSENRSTWRGTVMAVFQPGEEIGQGARAMIEDGMVKRFPKPVVCLGQHVMPLSAGQIGWHVGAMLSAGDSWEVTLFGRGAHGSMPQRCSWFDATEKRRSGGDGCVGGYAPSDCGVARGCDDRLRCGHCRHPASGNERERDSGSCTAPTQCPHLQGRGP